MPNNMSKEMDSRVSHFSQGNMKIIILYMYRIKIISWRERVTEGNVMLVLNSDYSVVTLCTQRCNESKIKEGTDFGASASRR